MPTLQGGTLPTETLGLIGTGMIGSRLAKLATNAGINVLLSNSRGPESLTEMTAELGPRARAVSAAQVAAEADLVVATIPLHAYRSLSTVDLAGKIVIDTMNYYPERDGRLAALDELRFTSSSLVQDHLADSRVVKAFNTLGYASLANGSRPPGSTERLTVPIAGNDREAKQQVISLINKLGFDILDTGDLRDSWRIEPGTPIYVTAYIPPIPGGMDRQAQHLWYLTAPTVPVPIDRARELVAAAIRGSAGGTL
ncbi:NADPH-dependent F420 reductase [Actinoplanes sp. NPDC049265]|uniref:NADPH-dependent F420 reductase n=1 Tax=Actinoplanes sp. NPDC049265 TaxID=3363902 RepID=UPI00371C784E